MRTDTKEHLLVTSGDGPRECRRAVFLVLRQMEREAGTAGLRIDATTLDVDKPNEPASALVSLSGAGADKLARSWQGTIQWICKSPFRPQHKRRNWFVGVFRVSGADNTAFRLTPQDLKIETFRSGGPGGQHQNTTDSGVRVTHLATGLSAISTEERSQHRNRKRALERLEARFLLKRQEETAKTRADRNSKHRQLERGNPVRVFKGETFIAGN